MDWDQLLETMPDKPGVYLMKSKQGEIIYVGKALSLKKRVRSYAQPGKNASPKTHILVSHIHSVDYIVTDTEIEALILESNLIKKHKPRYNINLKDDKHFPYIQVTWTDSYPRIVKARKMKDDGDRYFGPFTDAGAVAETLDLIRSVFRLRDCRIDLLKDPPSRPCLNYHIKRCPAPCQGYISQEEYNQTVSDAVQFLEGKQEDLIKSLKQEMKQASDQMAYEKAARLRDRIQAVEKITARQKISASLTEDRDIVALSKEEARACIQIFYMREGKLLGRDQYRLDDTEGMAAAEILSSFLKQYYNTVLQVPKEIIVPEEPDDLELVQQWLSQKRGSKVKITVPRRGKKKELLQMAEKNTHLALEEWAQRDLRSHDMTWGALEALKAHLNLETVPTRIECYDISNIQGHESVGSMVVFIDGKPMKKAYRRFQIRTVNGPDDFAMMKEVLTRRLKKLTGPRIQEDDGEHAFDEKPQLIVVDGGKGQVSAAYEALKESGFADIPLIGLAKEREEIFPVHHTEPLVLPRSDQGLRLLQRIRDEAHRFAVSYHRNLRTRKMVNSVLDGIPGIGKQRKTMLLKEFGSLQGIRNADPDAIGNLLGISRARVDNFLGALEKEMQDDSGGSSEADS